MERMERIASDADGQPLPAGWKRPLDRSLRTHDFDLGIAKQLRRGIELNMSIDNLTNRDYYETQNYFASRVSPLSPAAARIHATPGYPLAAVVGVTFRLGGK